MAFVFGTATKYFTSGGGELHFRESVAPKISISRDQSTVQYSTGMDKCGMASFSPYGTSTSKA